MLVDLLTHALLTLAHAALREWRDGPFSFAYQWDDNNLLLRDKAHSLPHTLFTDLPLESPPSHLFLFSTNEVE